ncbi:MAG: hypothetical protein SH819_09320 [Cytophagales bacterium]|nr:hypothetical protein [Cytophagales bacterium]
MQKIISTVILLAVSVALTAQPDQEIHMIKNFWSVKFLHGPKLVKPREVLEVMKANPQAYEEFQKAKSNYEAAQVIGAIGGFMIGLPLGTAITGRTPEWGLAAGGLGLVLLSIPFTSSFLSHSENAIKIYNGGSGSASTHPSIHLVPMGYGAKIVIRF